MPGHSQATTVAGEHQALTRDKARDRRRAWSHSGMLVRTRQRRLPFRRALESGALLVVAQVAISCVLLSIAVLFARSLNNLTQLDAGFERSPPFARVAFSPLPRSRGVAIKVVDGPEYFLVVLTGLR